MSSDRIIADAIKVAQDFLRQNLPPTHSLTDTATVTRVRELVQSPSIRSALERSSDTLLAFALREVERELLMTSTALAAGAMVMHLFDAFAQPSAAQGALIARAKSLELDTPYVPPPGDALEHHASGFAKIICAAVFVTGLDPDFAAENVGYFTAPYEVRHKLGKPVIDRAEAEAESEASHVHARPHSHQLRHLGDAGRLKYRGLEQHTHLQ
jgi:hypothetical protein